MSGIRPPGEPAPLKMKFCGRPRVYTYCMAPGTVAQPGGAIPVESGGLNQCPADSLGRGNEVESIILRSNPGMVDVRVSVVEVTDEIPDQPRAVCPVPANTRTTSAVVMPLAVKLQLEQTWVCRRFQGFCRDQRAAAVQ